jgi:hypothetical protein
MMKPTDLLTHHADLKVAHLEHDIWQMAWLGGAG